MLFNSIEFALFLPIVFSLYWYVVNKNIKLQNALLLFASYFFYGWWDWKFLSLIAFSSIVDYAVGIGLSITDNRIRRKFLLLTSILTNLGFLGFFKYFNFFAENFAEAFTFLGQPISDPALLSIVLPVGISFYTFQTLSYTIDVYRRKFEPTKDIVAFFAFVSFFPQLVAGPIERAKNLLPQFYKKRTFEYDRVVDGMRQILWGLFKKIVIADNCAIFANDIFANYNNYSGSTLLLGAFFFAFQIYGDFSGYSDIAIGTARLFGFRLMRNFAFPYFSRDIAEFWRRWHISLSTWFRDYVYIPLGGSHGRTWTITCNIFVIFIVSGFWHGANWTFIAWGTLNAIYILPLILINKNRKNTDTVAEGRWLPNINEILQIGITFLMTSIAWIFFRAENVQQALSYLNRIFSVSFLTLPEIHPKKEIILLMIFVLIEWLQRDKQHALQIELKLPRYLRWGIYYTIIIIIFQFSVTQQEFIYFQF
ncbi:MAG: MBOAT family protein [Candidatus Scalindua sp.]|jgi:D-alanyl-lipoteichoic acid acyltransferase DltB (MBOAT superfamily)|nr:MBOAT family protein [Candidatus Scalindua sp.]MBT5305074.1 MBOAT family protein [Candidatus Scalindua sp.]MBT6046340.1 MBOAT family protein [Candidatus Scalindua sp.]MBT6563237.1 MBOAT family protein [Candidatus Scalindua sp.]MBT7210652.1 MBOAT family protein [Candidatus Scalindua sp.]